MVVLHPPSSGRAAINPPSGAKPGSEGALETRLHGQPVLLHEEFSQISVGETGLLGETGWRNIRTKTPKIARDSLKILLFASTTSLQRHPLGQRYAFQVVSGWTIDIVKVIHPKTIHFVVLVGGWRVLGFGDS